MKIYKWVPGFPMKIDPNKFGEEFESCRKEYGEVNGENMCKWASAHPGSIIHKQLEWDDSKAGQRWRKDQCNRLIAKFIVIEIAEKPKNIDFTIRQQTPRPALHIPTRYSPLVSAQTPLSQGKNELNEPLSTSFNTEDPGETEDATEEAVSPECRAFWSVKKDGQRRRQYVPIDEVLADPALKKQAYEEVSKYIGMAKRKAESLRGMDTFMSLLSRDLEVLETRMKLQMENDFIVVPEDSKTKTRRPSA